MKSKRLKALEFRELNLSFWTALLGCSPTDRDNGVIARFNGRVRDWGLETAVLKHWGQLVKTPFLPWGPLPKSHLSSVRWAPDAASQYGVEAGCPAKWPQPSGSSLLLGLDTGSTSVKLLGLGALCAVYPSSCLPLLCWYSQQPPLVHYHSLCTLQKGPPQSPRQTHCFNSPILLLYCLP